MSNKIPVTLKSKSGKDLVDGEGNVSLGNGFCVMPFVYKGVTYKDKCYKSKHGDMWCATKVEPKTRKLRKYAICDFSQKDDKASPDVAKNSPKPVKVKTKKQVKKYTHKKIPEGIDMGSFGIPEDKSKLSIKKFVLNNRKNFGNWFDEEFKKYRVKKGAKLKKGLKMELFNHQKIVRDYMQHDSPYRGLLLYYVLVVG